MKHHLLKESAAHHRSREIDLLAVGELLVDLISHEVCEHLGDAVDFRRYQGGSPANLAANMARVGNRLAMVACVGNENLGKFLINQVRKTGIDTRYIATDPVAPTSVVLISRTHGTPDFIAYRTADRMLLPDHIPDELLQRSTLFHTTCFALSRNPAQKTILAAAQRAVAAGCRLSLDANYAPSVWPDRQEAQQVIARYCRKGALVKLSLDDVARLFHDPGITGAAAIQRFHQWGAEVVCLTRGAEGSIVSWEKGHRQQQQPARPVTPVDATGAGDAFWAGFLTAWLDGYAPPECAMAGSNLAALKLGVMGPLPAKISRNRIYEEF